MGRNLSIFIDRVFTIFEHLGLDSTSSPQPPSPSSKSSSEEQPAGHAEPHTIRDRIKSSFRNTGGHCFHLLTSAHWPHSKGKYDILIRYTDVYLFGSDKANIRRNGLASLAHLNGSAP